MKHLLKKAKKFYIRHRITLLYLITTGISLSAFLYFYYHGQQNLAAYDAIARLNIARKIIDSVTPGIGQLGGIWLPFPQMLMIPFIWNSALWHSGIAGYIVSGLAFIIGAVYLEKTAYLITSNRKISALIWAVFVTNINLLYLQTTALSEIFFIFCLIMVMYFLTKWIRTHTIIDFLLAAFFLTMITLTRYEGYFVFIGAVITVGIECILRYRREGVHKIEGMMLLFLTVAGYGIFLWCLYCVLFYKDPLYWLHLYSTNKSQIPNAIQTAESITSESVTSHTSYASAFFTYGEAIFALNGIVTVLLAISGLVLITKSWKRVIMPLAIVTVVLYIFLIYGYHRGFIPQITFPYTTMRYPLDISFNPYGDTNIRYGIIMAPLLVLLAGLGVYRHKIFGILITGLLIGQFVISLYAPQMLYLSIPTLWHYPQFKTVTWFKHNYDKGYILMSANKHEDFIFQSGLPYRDFIYEGNRNVWLTSLDDPMKYTTWVIYSDAVNTDYVTQDSVHDFMTPHAYAELRTQYTLVYNNDGYKIFKKRP